MTDALTAQEVMQLIQAHNVGGGVNITTGQVIAAVVAMATCIWFVFQWIMKGKTAAEEDRAKITMECIELAKKTGDASMETAKAIGELAANVASMTECMRGHDAMMQEQHKEIMEIKS